LAVAVLPVPPFVDDTVTEFCFSPTVLPVTVTPKVQVDPAVREPPARATVLGEVVARVPPQAVPEPVLTVRPAGSVSVKATPVRVEAVFGFRIEKLRMVVLPVKIGLAVNVFEMTGGAMTVRFAVP
jgi:hypothetical protein